MGRKRIRPGTIIDSYLYNEGQKKKEEEEKHEETVEIMRSYFNNEEQEEMRRSCPAGSLQSDFSSSAAESRSGEGAGSPLKGSW